MQHSKTVTRFAPSPNGSLHLGHAYAALIANDRAVRDGGRALLRIEDIDGARSRSELADEFRADMEWLGLHFEEVAMQSSRLSSYKGAADRLKEMGLLYPCSCTRAEIAMTAHTTGPEGPLYPGTCRDRGPHGDGPFVWRLDVARACDLTGPLTWDDEIAGVQQARPDMLGDVALLRKDAPASYHLAVTLDDAADRVSVVTRGMDLFLSTHVHRLLQALLELPVPRWHHHALLVESDGRKLAKRRGSLPLCDRRRAGENGIALADALRSGRFPAGISLAMD